MKRNGRKSRRFAAAALALGFIWCLIISCMGGLKVRAQEGSGTEQKKEQEEIWRAEEIQRKRKEIKASYFPVNVYARAAGETMEMYLEDFGVIHYNGYSTNSFKIDGNTSYCLEPSQDTPGNGYYTAAEIDNNSELGKAMYYAVSSPGDVYVAQYWGNDGFWQMPDPAIAGVMPWGERYAYCHMFLSWIYSGYDWDAAFHGTSIPSMEWYEALKSDFQERLNYVVNVFPAVPPGFRAYVVNTGDSSQVMSAWQYTPAGSLKLKKESANTGISDGNSCYHLENAQYGVYTDMECTKKAGTLVTDAQGESGKLEVEAGTYYIKEEQAPYGYALDGEVHSVVVESGKDAVVTVSDHPQNNPVTILIGKADAETMQNTPQGTSSFENAEFTVKHYPVQSESNPAEQGVHPLRTWVLKTDKNGAVMLDEKYKVSGDGFYFDSTGKPTLPLGTVTIQETKAPKGYLLNKEVFVQQILPGGTEEGIQSYQAATVPETPQKGRILLQKQDKETGKNHAQGAGTLEGAVYDIFLKSAYRTGDHTGSASYRESLVTNKEGMAQSSELPLDTYYVKERQAGAGYLVDEKIYEAALNAENKTERVFSKTVTSEEEIIRGDVEIIKLKENEDEDSDTIEGLGGIEFTFTSNTTGKAVKKITTDKHGYASTRSEEHPKGGLPYDTYTVTETKHPAGLKPIEPFQVAIREDGVTLKGIYKEDKLIVSPVSVVKVDKGTGKKIPVAGTEFRLLDEKKKPVTMTTYYPDQVVHKTFRTDENGQFTFPQKLKYGTYYLEEVKAPDGYLKGELLEFEVTEGAVWEEPLIISYENENAMGQIRVVKTSGDKEEKLTGVLFEIRAAEDIVTPDGTLRMKKGELADTLTTEDGEAVSKPLFLGVYEVIETKQQDGFVLDEKRKRVELQYKNQTTPVVEQELKLVNHPTRLELLKIDADNKKPLEGVKFKVWNKAMESEPDAAMGVVQEFVTDEEGMLAIERLVPGTYCFQETETLEGYVLSEEVYELTIDEKGKVNGEEAGRLIVENKPVKPETPEEENPPKEEIPKEEKEVPTAKTGDDTPWLNLIIFLSVSFLSCFIVLKCQR